MFGEALCPVVFLLAATFHPGFPTSPLFLDCIVDSCIPPSGLFWPPVFRDRPAHIFICIQQAGALRQIWRWFFCMKISIFWFKLLWNLFPSGQPSITSIGLCHSMMPSGRHAIIWTSDGLVWWHIYASVSPNELNDSFHQRLCNTCCLISKIKYQLYHGINLILQAWR